MIKDEEVIRSASATDVEPPTGSPIIIGGGGGQNTAVACTFTSGEYDEIPKGSRTRFSHSGEHPMRTLILKINDDVTLDLSTLLIGEDVEILVRCEGRDNDLNFFLAPQAVEFDTDTYRRPTLPPAPLVPDVFQSEDSFASEIKIRLQDFEIKRELGEGDKFSLKADIV